MNKEFSPREAARLSGKNTYFTGKPCVNGHISDRRVSNALCIKCQSEYSRKWQRSNPDKVRSSTKRWLDSKPGKAAEYSLRYYHANSDKISIKRRAIYRSDPIPHRLRVSEWHRLNREKSNNLSTRRRARKLNASPEWDSCFTDFVMEEASDLAKRREDFTGIAWQIDHMIPLKARNACGLHTWSNLQVIPAKLNLSKNNRMIFTEPFQWIGSL